MGQEQGRVESGVLLDMLLPFEMYTRRPDGSV